MMGIWFFASAIGEFLAGKIGSLMSVPKDIAENGKVLCKHPKQDRYRINYTWCAADMLCTGYKKMDEGRTLVPKHYIK